MPWQGLGTLSRLHCAEAEQCNVERFLQQIFDTEEKKKILPNDLSITKWASELVIKMESRKLQVLPLHLSVIPIHYQ